MDVVFPYTLAIGRGAVTATVTVTELTVATANAVVVATLSSDWRISANAAAKASVYAYLAEVKPDWLIITLPHRRSVFRHIDFGAIAYSDPAPSTSEEIDEIIVADQLYTDGNQIDFIRRNESWFVFGQVDSFPVHPYEMTMIRYDPVARTTHSVSRKFTIRREIVTGAQDALPRHSLTMPLARNLFRRVNFGTINYTWPTPISTPLIDEIVIGNIEENDQNQLDFILRYDGWFVSAQLTAYPVLPYEITFIHHDTAARKTYTAPALLTITRDVDPTK